MRQCWIFLLLLSLAVGAQQDEFEVEFKVYPPKAKLFIVKPGSAQGKMFVTELAPGKKVTLSRKVHFGDHKAVGRLEAPGREPLEFDMNDTKKRYDDLELKPLTLAGSMQDFFYRNTALSLVLLVLICIIGCVGVKQRLRAKREQKLRSLGGNLHEPFGGYILLERIGAGGMAEVFKAVPETDQRPERVVALKRILQDYAEDEEFRQRFQRETRVISELDHPGLVAVEDYGDVDGNLYLAMELIEGRPLSKLIETDAPLEVEQALTIMESLCEALAHAHEKGVIHRDISAGNVMVTHTGQAKILDFGLARRADELDRITQTGMITGTPNYIPMERFMEAEPDGRSDQFSVAVLAFGLLTGGTPFVVEPNKSGQVDIFSSLMKPRVPATRLRPELPAAVDEVFEKALANDMVDRYPDMRAFFAALRKALKS